ncbi:TPA_asm: trimethylamine-N-oxide reductase TorA [Salmonella enterica subsp. salamae serovar 60:g,m,t:z6]|uniref:trimethylamine-N-oxide reductase n=1 Tax=Salmonella enterica subsp. houtenae serovar 1,40:z4,z32:- TaxID=1967604 RepID=A0A730WBW9_SALHO|nr:trimethylamine-N-oxide reductase TorA [Salmonella enterica]HAC6699668.1 trimethylamine-N-oxide reductase TorA [Salmonella bongori serovar 66:z65:-]HAE2268569.1 trimethylamine-N-oxide reductase TorA [Salmonella enterica subsp. enterica serovar 1,9,12:-:-]HAE4189918.1 trimethylamine-N-oxide reductase TorA [Salmonella enterica subsp. houtenae serovar 1,40:z4,z32:-]HAE7514278.1 trimethylamine-N-oxide reductase TorA [Salmonella enterica subsp. salamae serovar 60:g,m,t:z6]
MDSQEINASRRRFLTAMLAVGAASALAPSPLIKKAWAAGENPEQWIQSGSHFGAFEAKVMNGEWIATRPFKHDKYPCDMLNAVREVVYNPSRVRYPMVRLDWLRQREKSDRRQRGDNRFVRVSWDRALDLFYEELERVQKTYGSSGVFTGLADWQMVGKYHKAGGAMDRGLGLHGSYVTTVGDYSAAAAQVILPHVIGSLEVYEQQTSLPLVIEHSQTIVLWGCDPIKNLQIEFLVPDHDAFGYWAQIKEAVKQGKIRVISVDPVRSKTQNYLNCEQLSLRPQTDVALMLGVAHTLYVEKRYDVNFINDYTVGFEQFLPYLLGTTDKQPKDAQWAAEICGLSAENIRDFARVLVNGRTQFMGGWCVQRMHHGEQYPWMLVVLASMVGQIGLPGGGVGFGWHYNGGGTVTSAGPVLSGLGSIANPPAAKYKPDFRGASEHIPTSRIVDCLLAPGKKIAFNGETLIYPDIKMAIYSAANPFHAQQDRNRMIEAWEKLETVVVLDHQWTASCRFADIVLPVTTRFERNDIEQFGTHSNKGLMALHQVVKPQFEARHDFDIFAGLCKRFDREAAYRENRDEMQWINAIYDEGVKTGAALGVTLPDFDSFWQGEGYIEYPAGQPWVRHSEFREQPDLNPLGTPSGLIEIFSKTIAGFGYADCPGHPVWMEPFERSHSKTTTKYPLHLQSCHPDKRLHSQLCSSDAFRKTYAVAGREPLYMCEQDARARGLKAGDIARVFNDRGQVLAGVAISADYVPGVIRIHEGAWYSPQKGGKAGTLCTYGDPNVLSADVATSQLAQGPSAHTVLVEVERYQPQAPDVTGFGGPDTVKEEGENAA